LFRLAGKPTLDLFHPPRHRGKQGDAASLEVCFKQHSRLVLVTSLSKPKNLSRECVESGVHLSHLTVAREL
jgi:hypothetical protein